MKRAEQEQQNEECQRKEYIRQILQDSPYLPVSEMYKRCERELSTLTTDVLMVLTLEVKKTQKAKGGEVCPVSGKNREQIKKEIAHHLSNNIGLYDCQGDCPDEVAFNPERRTPAYCNSCFARQILAIIENKERG